MSALFGLLAVAAYASAVAGVVLMRSRVRVEHFDDELAASARERRGPITALMDWLGRRAAPLIARRLHDRGRREALKRRLDAAGRPNGITVERYVERKARFAALGLALALALALAGYWIMAIGIAVLGWIWVDIDVDGRARRRQARIDKDLPDFLDVLAVCVNAGIAFRPAMARVADALGGPVGEEVTTTLRQMALGASRREAFEALRDRNTSEFVGAFTSSFLQAEELGVGLADALVDLARDMRAAAFQAARRRAQQAAPRVSLIVTLLIMPAAVLMVLVSLVVGSDVSFGELFGS